jgi:hypothetical protein
LEPPALERFVVKQAVGDRMDRSRRRPANVRSLMMKILRGRSHVKRSGATLSALLVLGLVLSASASAAKPEWRGPLPQNFTISGSGMSLESPGGFFASCSSVTGSGQLLSHKKGTGTLTLSGCSTLPGFCFAWEGKSGEVKTTQLELEPVYIEKSTATVGILFKPQTGTTFAKLNCQLGSVGELKGSIVAKVPQRRSKEFSLEFMGFKGTQTPSKYENEAGVFVNSWLEIGYGQPLKFQNESWNGTPILHTESEIEFEK